MKDQPVWKKSNITFLNYSEHTCIISWLLSINTYMNLTGPETTLSKNVLDISPHPIEVVQYL